MEEKEAEEALVTFTRAFKSVGAYDEISCERRHKTD